MKDNCLKTRFKITRLAVVFIFVAILSVGFEADAQSSLKVPPNINYCATQAQKTLGAIPASGNNLPRNIDNGKTDWRYVNYKDWCSGFWPGILWYLYEGTHDQKWKTAANKFTQELKPLSEYSGFDHDLGFMVFNSFGNGYRLTKDPGYKQVILRSADSLATLFNPKVGTILSWPAMVKKMNWPHNTIIDNMINLELLFWASKNGGSRHLYDIAVKHAETTMHNHFRPDYTSYHVVVYDTVTGKKIQGITHQGYADNSMWARGQSWAIYGFTMCYRETGNAEFLDFAQKVADVYLNRLPADLIPYWDFDDPTIPNAPKDASAACITASALLELSTFVKDKTRAWFYRHKAEAMLQTLSSSSYQSRGTNDAFLLHSTGHHPAGTEIDASIIYADYYYLEALLRREKLQHIKAYHHYKSR
ncbi:glycoside hydrolase family 88 protein [Mucilaginibacter dorajii]|uniref:Glycoside hydrolase family 88 protein n=1 Tax=Mucilaginibacter dorajii TaxID=692994 RepID=A0ABP7PAJ8_9SPHI|nr:glycoside hydrolase family 88 protein [Mucilaginibacter dorajii]MCS3735165.1 unsaturated chondroitin disaccharide hydrolase [Mucilaginibacter dorajii]